MNQQIAIIIAGALIAGAIALTNHWALVTQTSPNLILLLNRWTGIVVMCAAYPGVGRFELSCPPAPMVPSK